MSQAEFARRILFGTTLAEKLAPPLIASAHETLSLHCSFPNARALPLEQIPVFPGRPPGLARPGKARFPDLADLAQARTRGEVLHFFANHELLAMELMALVLLRFPEAPAAFQTGIVRTIEEEQAHLQLYLGRMRELGVGFGDLPVSDYFWNTLRCVRSPLEFVVQMSLTLEQANLDYSLFYRDAIAAVGDTATAAILDRVYREEIGHVKHGLRWFNEWRKPGAPGAAEEFSESDWDAYVRLLPAPMTPTRAKGIGFTAEGRREAGFSETYIRQLGLYSGSKGRPPVWWFFNPHCDLEIARGTPGYIPSERTRRVTEDLEHLPMFLALDKDLVRVSRKPRMEWIEHLQAAGFRTPLLDAARLPSAPKLGGIQPWGWSPDAWNVARPLDERLVDLDGGNAAFCKHLLDGPSFAQSGLSALFSKAWSTRFLAEWLAMQPPDVRQVLGAATGFVCQTLSDAHARILDSLHRGQRVAAKAPYGTSGRGVRQIRQASDLESPIGGWIKNILLTQGEIVIESWLDKVNDLSLQIMVHADRIELLEARSFVNGPQYEYRGTDLGKKFAGLSPEALRFLHSILEPWRELARSLGQRVHDNGYRGPAGIDAMIWRQPDGELRFKPLVELNPRWTMGRVALELEKRLSSGVSAIWAWLPVREIAAQGYPTVKAFAEALARRYPITLGPRSLLQSGVVFTSDPERVTEVFTALAILPCPEIESSLRPKA